MTLLVVVVQSNELAQRPVTCQGGSLVGDALHVAAISKDAVSAEILLVFNISAQVIRVHTVTNC